MIVFTQDIATDKINNAFNNNVIKFSSNSSEVALNSDVIINGQVVTIYPTPDGSFYFNFREYVTGLVNANEFKDLVNPILDPLDDTTFTYLGSGYYVAPITIRINFANNTNETTFRNVPFLNSVEQIETYKRNVTQNGSELVLLPLYPNTTNKYYAKYFEGYPFDVSFLQIDVNDIELTNNTNLLDYTFDFKGFITRLFFSDGRIDESINDLLPIALGRNEISWLDKFLILDKEDVCGGVYVKWLNNYGGYSYWLFPNYATRSLSAKNIGEIDNDFNNLTETFSRVSQIGMNANERLVVSSDKLTNEAFNLLRTILTSPKIYLFTGEPFSQSDANDWMEVKLNTNNTRTRNPKNQANEIILDIDLPDYYTQTL